MASFAAFQFKKSTKKIKFISPRRHLIQLVSFTYLAVAFSSSSLYSFHRESLHSLT